MATFGCAVQRASPVSAKNVSERGGGGMGRVTRQGAMTCPSCWRTQDGPEASRTPGRHPRHVQRLAFAFAPGRVAAARSEQFAIDGRGRRRGASLCGG
jgi:hypothetical protein